MPPKHKLFCRNGLRHSMADYEIGRHFRLIRTAERTDFRRPYMHRKSANQPFLPNLGSLKRLEIRLGMESDLFGGQNKGQTP